MSDDRPYGGVLGFGTSAPITEAMVCVCVHAAAAGMLVEVVDGGRKMGGRKLLIYYYYSCAREGLFFPLSFWEREKMEGGGKTPLLGPWRPPLFSSLPFSSLLFSSSFSALCVGGKMSQSAQPASPP